LSAQNGKLMLKSDKFEFERGAAAKTENEERDNGYENRAANRLARYPTSIERIG
jgi:hypothetical protein